MDILKDMFGQEEDDHGCMVCGMTFSDFDELQVHYRKTHQKQGRRSNA